MNEIIDRGTMEVQITSPAGKRLFVKDKVIPKNIDVVPNLINLSVAANGKYTPAEGYTGFNEVDVQVLGGEGGTVVPLTALVNEEYTTAYTYQYDTIRIDANTVPDIITESDGSETPVLKLSGWLPETLSKGTIANLGIIMRTKDADGVENETLLYGGEISGTVDEIASPEDTGISGLWISDNQGFLYFIQDATSFNTTLGTDYFENNSIYMFGNMLTLLIQYAKLGYMQYWEWVVPVNGTKIENVSFNPVTVDVYIPTTSDEQLEIIGPAAGSTVTHDDDGTYYNKIKVTSLPAQTVDVELKETAQTITANSGYVLKQVNVPAATINTPEGDLSITENGSYDVTDKATVTVDVPVPDGYVQPDGTLTLTENGDYDITYYKQVNVNVSSINVAYGETEPIDTSKLWIKTNEPNNVIISQTLEQRLKQAPSNYLPEPLSSVSAVRIGTKVYLFGGYSATKGYLNTIHCFDIEAKILTTSSTVLPKSLEYIGAAAVGDKIYLFGGYNRSGDSNTIYCFNTTTGTLTTIAATLPVGGDGISTVAVGTKIYLLGGYSSKSRASLNTIHCFDTETETLTTLSTTLTTAVGYSGFAMVGTKIYLLGGISGTSTITKTIQCFDIETQNISILSTTLPKTIGLGAAASVGTKIYFFGGEDGENYVSSIYCLDTETQTITTLSAVLPRGMSRIGITAIDTKIYLFGGTYSRSTNVQFYFSSIRCFDTETEILSIISTSLVLPRSGECLAAVGSKIYLFGENYTNIIQCFDTETQTTTVLSATLPVNATLMSAAAVGTKIYLFGGYDGDNYLSSIRCFDTETNTISTVSASLPRGIRDMSVAAVGTQIYLFGGLGYHLTLISTESAAIYRFNTETETLSTLSATLPIAAYQMGIAAVGTKIYLFGGSPDVDTLNTINCFDTETQTISTLSTRLSTKMASMGVAAVGTKVYLFGGHNGDLDAIDTISCFDTETEIFTSLSVTLPRTLENIGVASVGTKIYIFGGEDSWSDPEYMDMISIYYTAFELAPGAVQIIPTLEKNIFKMINNSIVTMDNGVSEVYVGNANAEIEKVEAYLHNGTEWTSIYE